MIRPAPHLPVQAPSAPSGPFDYTGLDAPGIEERGRAGLAAADAAVERALGAPAADFDSLIGPLEEAGELLIETSAQTAFLAEVGDEAQREAGRDVRARIERWHIALLEREDLAERVLAFAATPAAAALPGPRARALAEWTTGLRHAGHGLSADARAELGRLRREIVDLEGLFEENLAEPIEPLIVAKADLAGLPGPFVRSLEIGPRRGTRRLPIESAPVWIVVEQSPVRPLRERVMRAWLSRAVERNEPVLNDILARRRRIAAILGYRSWAHLRTERRMARSPERVEAFFAELLPGLSAGAEAEAARIRAMLRADSGEEAIAVWDTAYYGALLRRDDHGVDPEAAADYFPLDAVLAGFFGLAAELFGIRIAEVPAAGAWHAEVRRFTVSEAASGEILGTFDADLFARPGKYGGVAVYTLRPGHRAPDGAWIQAYSAIVANLPRPNAEQPSLLGPDDVRSMFHELGHILHQLLSRAELASRSGAMVARDFVEAPSQMVENLLRDPEILARFARHYLDGSPIPLALAAGLAQSAEATPGLFWLRQVYLARLDLALHGDQPVPDVRDLCRSLWPVTLRAYPEGTYELASFEHLMSYDAGYYGYLWAQVLGDDLWSRFTAAGGLNPAVGAAYRREILEPGDERDANELIEAFLGRPASSAAFLGLRGLR